MIHRIYSSDPAFKTLVFHRGFNVLIADKAEDSTDLQTRNGAGKSSFVRIVHFLLGGSCNKGECMFLNDALKAHTFGMEFDIAGETIAVERSGERPSRVFFTKGQFRNWPVAPRIRRNDDRASLTNEEWKAVLGTLMFHLRLAYEEERAEKFIPTFRGLFPYFARLHEDGGFLEPYKTFSDQQLWHQQVAITFLLGLDWRIPQSMQLIRARERTIRQLQQVIEESGTDGLLPRSDDLQAQLTVAIDHAQRIKKDLLNYRINPQYHELEAEANSVTTDIAATLDEDTWDRELITNLEQALKVEVPPDPVDLRKMYEQASVDLPETATKRFDEVRTFHESVLRNRQSYLSSELSAANARLSERFKRRAVLDERRASIMTVLSSTGALDQFTHLQGELGRIEGQVESLKRQTAAAKEIEDTTLQLEIERNELELRLGRNQDEQADRITEAQILFARLSQRLFESAGALTVSRKLSGPPVRVQIHGQESVGITKMQIYCFDMTMLQVTMEQNVGPRFLIHDSHLFDGVDARQVAHALEEAISESTAKHFQYFVTLNSDKVETVRETGLDLSTHAVPVRLTDQETGGLFGKRFG